MSTSYASVQPDAHTRFQCRHIFPGGLRCGSPCLRNENFCYYHHESRKAIRLAELEARKAHQEGRSPSQAVFDLPTELADRSGLQAAIADVLRRIARNELDPRRAGLLLYGLQIATLTLPREPRAEPARGGYSRYTGHREPDAAVTTVEDVELDPELGPLAPIAEMPDPERSGTVYELLEKLRRDEPFDEPVSPVWQWPEDARSPLATADTDKTDGPAASILPEVQGFCPVKNFAASPARLVSSTPSDPQEPSDAADRPQPPKPRVPRLSCALRLHGSRAARKRAVHRRGFGLIH